jgi:hypothetical protein
MADLGYDWVVRPLRSDLPPVAQGHSTSKASAQLVVELILLGEPIAERGELTGPRGQVWTCRLNSPGGAQELCEKGRLCWDPE